MHPTPLTARRAAVLRPGIMLAAVAALLPTAARAAPCLPLACNFSISGKRGAFLAAQLKPEDLTRNDAAMSAGLSGGRTLAEQSLNRGELSGTGLYMRETERAMNEMLLRLRQGWAKYPTLRPPPAVTVRIVGSTAFNPSARPDNVIVLPLGVLIRAGSDDEVAWVMAHEFSHIALAHFAREARERQVKSAVSRMVDGLQAAADLSQVRMEPGGGGRMRLVSVENKQAQQLAAVVWAHSRDVGVGLELLNQRLSRRQEDQADVAGLDLVLAAGYNDEGPGNALVRVKEDEDRLAASLHSFDQQITEVSKRAAAVSLGKIKKGDTLAQTAGGFLDDMKRNVSRVVMNKAIDVAKTSHRPAEKRKRGISDYIGDAHPDLVPPRRRTDWLTAVRARPEFKEGQAATEACDRVVALLGVSRLDEAQAALRPALATRYRSTPLVANAAARIAAGMGNNAEADRLYDLAEKPASATQPAAAPAARRAAGKKKAKTTAPTGPAALPPPPAPNDVLFTQSIEGFGDHVSLLVLTRNYPKALTVIATAKARFGDDLAFLPALIAIYAQTRKVDLLAATIGRCMETEDDGLRKKCQYAVLNDDQSRKIEELSPDDRAKVELAMAKSADTSRQKSWWKSVADSLQSSED